MYQIKLNVCFLLKHIIGDGRVPLDGLDQTIYSCKSVIWNLYRQEEQAEAAAAGPGEDLCHLSAYNRRLRATQSPNDSVIKKTLGGFNHARK